MTLDGLKAEKRWVLWRLEKKDGKDTKPPYQPSGHLAQNNNPSHWNTFAVCEAAFLKGGFTGVGMVLGGGVDRDGQPLTSVLGVDGDDCVDEDKKFSPESRELVIALNSYSEYSPSDRGFHCWVLAELGDRKGIQKPYPGCKQVEVKGAGYYHTFTGRHLSKTPHEILPRQAEIDALYAKLAAGTPSIVIAVPQDEQARFDKLWRGDLSDYDGDHSRADLALCCILARRCRNNLFKMDEEFRKSGLYREKWERTDYSSQTLLRAIQGNAVGIGPSEELEEDAPADWTIAPLPGRADGWFPSRELSLIGGSSGAGKTHMLLYLLTRLGQNVFGHESKKQNFGILLLDRGRAALKRSCIAAKMPKEMVDRIMGCAIQLTETQRKLGTGVCLESVISQRPEIDLWVIEGLDIWIPKIHDIESVSDVLRQIIAVLRRHNKTSVATVGSPKQKENDRYAAGRDQFMGSVVFGRMCETCISLTRTTDKQVRQMTVLTRNTADEEFWFTWEDGRVSQTTEPAEIANSTSRAESAIYRMEQNVFASCKPGDEIRWSKEYGAYSTFERWRKQAYDEGIVSKSNKKWFRAPGCI